MSLSNPATSSANQGRSVPGFAQAVDPMAGLSRHQQDDDEAIDFLDFEDTYDGLGDQLEETGDNYNNDTFGGETTVTATASVGMSYDFFGRPTNKSDSRTHSKAHHDVKQQQKSKVSPTTAKYSQPTLKSQGKKPEGQTNHDQVPEMLVDAKIWGVAPRRAVSAAEPSTASRVAPNGRKMMSVEEIESAVLAQNRKPKPVPQQILTQPKQQEIQRQPQQVLRQDDFQLYPHQSYNPRLQLNRTSSGHDSLRANQSIQPIHVLQRPQQPIGQAPKKNVPQTSQQTNQNLISPRRFSSDQHRSFTPRSYPNSAGSRHMIHSKPIPRSAEEKAAFLAEEAKRERRNRKIFLLSKDNGLMTPQDKNYITRIQLQQLVVATGNPNENGIDSNISEDFYYQVHRRIKVDTRQSLANPGFQSGGGFTGMRRPERGAYSHMQQMELQVQRAVEAAKNKPKNKQLVIEGSLGKISFSNSKTPKPLLNLKRSDNRSESTSIIAAKDRKASHAGVTGSDRKTILTDIENVYSTLMRMEDHDRQIPPPLNGEKVEPELVNLHLAWQKIAQKFNQQLWHQLKVHEPIGATTTHPFIAFLSFRKGKKAIPRVFRHISQEQRTTIFTMIIVHLDQLDVVRQGVLPPGETQLSASVRESIEHFSLSVMPSLFGYLNETGLDIVTGILGLLLNINIDLIARTRIGVSMLTMILSRAEILKQAGNIDQQQEWIQWVSTYNTFFDTLESTLSNIFLGIINTSEDVYVWQFLAAIGIGANPEQQQRLVMAVKDRVMETVSLAKTLPPAISSQRLANVNLFMRSIGLDVELLS